MYLTLAHLNFTSFNYSYDFLFHHAVYCVYHTRGYVGEECFHKGIPIAIPYMDCDILKLAMVLIFLVIFNILLFCVNLHGNRPLKTQEQPAIWEINCNLIIGVSLSDPT